MQLKFPRKMSKYDEGFCDKTSNLMTRFKIIIYLRKVVGFVGFQDKKFSKMQ